MRDKVSDSITVVLAHARAHLERVRVAIAILETAYPDECAKVRRHQRATIQHAALSNGSTPGSAPPVGFGGDGGNA
jgi:hypothetical protein